MGSLISRLNNQLNNNAVEETEASNNYKYPPKTGKLFDFSLFCNFFLYICVIFFSSEGNFFANTFIMGGERFDQAVPESYLFGENADLNFLGSKPIAVRQKILW